MAPNNVRTIQRLNQLVNLDTFLNSAMHRFEGWLDTQDYKESEKDDIRKAFEALVEAYHNGQVVPGIKSTKIIKSNSTLTNTPAFRRASGYLNYILSEQPEYIAPKESEEENKPDKPDKLEWKPEQGVEVALAKRLFGRVVSDPDFLLKDSWADRDQTTNKRQITNRYNLINQALDGIEDDYDINDEQKATIRKYIEDFRNAYQSGNTFTDDEWMEVNRLLPNARRFWFYKDENFPSEQQIAEVDPVAKESTKLDKQYAALQAESALKTKRSVVDQVSFEQYLDTLEDKYETRDYSNVKDYRNKAKLPEYLVPAGQGNTSLSEMNDEQKAAAKAKADSMKGKYYNTIGYNFSSYASSEDLYNGKNPITSFPTFQGQNYFNNDFNNLSENEKITTSQRNAGLTWIENLSADEKAKRRITASQNSTYNGWYIIDPVFNNSGYVTVTNSNITRIKRVPVRLITSTEASQSFKQSYIEELIKNQNLPSVGSYKQGGIIKAALGTEVDWDEQIRQADEAYLRATAAKKEAEEKAIETEAKTSNRTKEQVKADKQVYYKDGELTDIKWSAADKARIGALATDLVGLGLSLTQVGSAAGAATGLGSTAAMIYADIKDGVPWWQIATGAAAFTALDAFTLLPGLGTAGKIGKIVKGFRFAKNALLPLVPLLSPDVRETLFKVWDKGLTGDYTKEDLRNLTYIGSTLMQVLRHGITGLRRNAMRYNIEESGGYTSGSNKTTVTLKDGKSYTVGEGTGEIPKAKFDEILAASKDGLAKQNEILKSIPGFENAELRGNILHAGKRNSHASTRYINESNGNDVYDFSKLPESKGIFGFGSPNKRYTDAYIYNMQLNSNRGNLGLFSPNWYNKYVRGRSYKPAESTSRTTTTPATTSAPATTTSAVTAARTATRRATTKMNVNGTEQELPILDLRGKYNVTNLDRAKKAVQALPNSTVNLMNEVKAMETKLKSEGVLTSDATLHGFGYGPKGLFFWKQGGTLKKRAIEIARNGAVLKGQAGIPQWYLALMKEQAKQNSFKYHNTFASNLGNLDNANRAASSGVQKGQKYTVGLDEAFNKLNEYKSSGRQQGDISHYYQKLLKDNANLSTEDFITEYNKGIKTLNTYRQNWDGTDATVFNNLFNDLFNSRGTTQGDIGFSSTQVATPGSSTWLRFVDIYDDKFDKNNADHVAKRVFDVGDFKVYKENDGTIHLYNEANVNTYSAYDPNKPTQIINVSEYLANPEEYIKNHPEAADWIDKEGYAIKIGTDIHDDPFSNYKYKTSADWKYRLAKALPAALGLARVPPLNRVNLQNARRQIEWSRPALEKAPEVWSPQHGDYPAIVESARQAATLMHSTPTYADMRLNTNAMRDANEQARKALWQGFKADNDARLQSMQEAWKNYANGIIERTKVANLNNNKIAAWKAQAADWLGQAKKENVENWDKYLKEVQTGLRDTYKEYESRLSEFAKEQSKLQYAAEVDHAKKIWEAKKATLPADYDYRNDVDYQNYMMAQTRANVNQLNYYNRYLDSLSGFSTPKLKLSLF